MSSPPWLSAVRTSFRHLFEAGSTTHDRCQLMAGDADRLVLVRAAGLNCRHERVDVYPLAGAPGYDGPPVAYLFGTHESVGRFKRAASAAGALIPGVPPDLFGAAWIAFLLQALRSIPPQVLRERAAAEQTDCDQVMVNPFLASLLVIDAAAPKPKPTRRRKDGDPEHLNVCDHKILKACANGAQSGKKLATATGYERDYIRARAGRLVRLGKLTRTKAGYALPGGACGDV